MRKVRWSRAGKARIDQFRENWYIEREKFGVE